MDYVVNRVHSTIFNIIWVRSWMFGCLATWFCYELIAKPSNKTAAHSWPNQYNFVISRIYIIDHMIQVGCFSGVGLTKPISSVWIVSELSKRGSPLTDYHIHGLVQERHNSIANALSYVFLALTHRFDSCGHSLAAATPVRYECVSIYNSFTN